MAGQNNAKMFLKTLEAGDTISFHKNDITHWGIYVGNKKVVHLTGKKKKKKDPSHPFFTVADKEYAKAIVKEDDFFVVAKMFDTYERNVFDKMEGMIPYNPGDIVKLAKVMKGRIFYDTRWNSCEKMAIFCRYVTPDDTPESEDEDDDKSAMQSILEAAAYIRRDDEESVTLLDEPEPAEEQLDIKAEKYIKQHNEKNLTELEEGDLVRIRHFLYDHWLVYIGNGEVIHFSSPDNKRGKKQRAKQFINNFSVFGALCPKGIVKRDKYSDVVSKGGKADKANKDGRFSPRRVEEIISTAEGKIGETGYNLLWNNCEQFAMKCRYGKKISYQVIVVMVFVAVTLVFIAGGLVLKYAD